MKFGMKILLCTGLLVFVVRAPIFAQEAASVDSSSLHDPYDLSNAAPVDKDDVYTSSHYPFLSLPRYLWSGLVYPLGQFAIYAEHAKIWKQYYEFFTNAAGTFGFFPVVQLGGETGTGGGGRMFLANLWGRGKMFEALYVYSGSIGQMGEGRYVDPKFLGSNLKWELEGAYLKTRNESATINEALGDDPVNLFQLEQIDVKSTLKWRRNTGPLALFKNTAGIDIWSGYGRRDFQPWTGIPMLLTNGGSTPEASRLIGLGKEITLYRFGGRALYDDRDFKTPTQTVSHPLNYRFPGRILTFVDGLYYSYRDLGYPERGGLASAEAEFVTGSDDVGFYRVQAEIQRYFTLFWKNRILAVRGRIEKVRRMGDDKIIPYTDLPSRGGTTDLRGYRRGYFRGQGALVFNAEYRYPIWDTWNAFVFWDEGQIFDHFEDVEMDHFRTSWGGGIAFRTEIGLLGKFQVGHSSVEKALIQFAVEQEF